jgi:hypothetical protein
MISRRTSSLTPENVTTMTDTSADSEASITTVTIEIPLLPDMLDEVDDEPGRGKSPFKVFCKEVDGL